MHKSFVYVLILIFASTLVAHAAPPKSKTSSQTESMNCGNDDPPLTVHDYVSDPGDVLQPHHLEVTRPFDSNGKLELRVCRANLRVFTRPDAKEIKLTVELKAQSLHSTVADYIRMLRVEPDHGIIQLKFPKQVHAIVTLTMPMESDSENQFNLGFGDLNFNAIGGSGDRKINVGQGNVHLLLDKDKDYSTMEINIGMGSLHDHRPGGSNSHIIVSRDYKGHGSGSLKINVGMGSLDIHND